MAPQPINGLVRDEIRDGLRGPWLMPLLSRGAPFEGLVTLRQIFVHRSQCGDIDTKLLKDGPAFHFFGA
jgi:hypothetical protein